MLLETIPAILGSHNATRQLAPRSVYQGRMILECSTFFDSDDWNRSDKHWQRTEPFLIAPDWVRDRVNSVGLTNAVINFRSLAASASEDGENVSANAYTVWVSVIERASQYPGRASARNSFMTIRKA
jgi:hypothetical protein